MIENQLTVSEIVHTLKQTIYQNELLRNVTLVGELSNFNPHRSGHFYFTMKDEKSRIDCVMFRSHASKVKFEPQNGDKIVITGYCDIYMTSGQVQIYAQTMTLDGLGDLHIRYEALKKELQKEGYFDKKLKKEIPLYPENIAVISGKNSAAHADIIKTLLQRWPYANINNYFAYVQGESAVPSLIESLRLADSDEDSDVIILSRGGGSIEDLWAFNNKELIQVIVSLKTPVIVGVGHESDITLADYAADARSATPTAAAVLASPNQVDIIKNITDYKNTYYIHIKRLIEKRLNDFNSLKNQSYLFHPDRFFGLKQQGIDEINMKFNQIMNQFQGVNRELLNLESSIIHGYERKTNQQSSFLVNINLKFEHEIKSRLQREVQNLSANQISSQQIHAYIKEPQKDIQYFKKEIEQNMNRKLENKKNQFVYYVDRLNNLSPLQTMMRGYSLTFKDKKVVKSINQIDVNDTISVQLKDGELKATVLDIEGKKKND